MVPKNPIKNAITSSIKFIEVDRNKRLKRSARIKMRAIEEPIKDVKIEYLLVDEEARTLLPVLRKERL